MRTSLYDLLLNDFDFEMPTRNTKGFNVDAIEGDNCYKVYAEIPGVDKKDITVDFEDGLLKIGATKNKKDEKYVLSEISSLPYYREINLGSVTEESIKAKYNDGILEVTINLKKPEEKAKKTIRIE